MRTETSEPNVEVRLLSEPCLWCWEIIDPMTGRVIESSWENRWAGYESRDTALAAGVARLTETVRGTRETRMSGRPRVQREGRKPRHLVVVAREAEALFESLRRTFDDGAAVDVIRDRRFAERRRRAGAVAVERRRADRRQRPGADAVLRERRWAVVHVQCDCAWMDAEPHRLAG